jgi:hypothetical protein
MKKQYSRNVIDVDWRLVVELAPPEKETIVEMFWIWIVKLKVA